MEEKGTGGLQAGPGGVDDLGQGGVGGHMVLMGETAGRYLLLPSPCPVPLPAGPGWAGPSVPWVLE